MVTTVGLLGLFVILAVHTAVAALATRFFRVRLHTGWGAAVYTALLVPLVLLVSTLVLGSILGPNLGSSVAVVGLAILLPMALGVTFDYFWMPAPEEVDLPGTRETERSRSRRSRRD